MGLDNVGAEIYDIHGYFNGMTAGQRALGFWGVIDTILILYSSNKLTQTRHVT